MTYATDYKLDNSIYESAQRNESRRDSALYAMRTVFENGELMVGGKRKDADDLLTHIFDNDQLAEAYKADVMRMVRGIDCGKSHINFWNEATDSFLDSMVDEWMENP